MRFLKLSFLPLIIPRRSRYFYANSTISITWNITLDLFARKVQLPYWFVMATESDHDTFIKHVRDNTSIPSEYTILSSGYDANVTYQMLDGTYMLRGERE
jgi:hypothetical protein